MAPQTWAATSQLPHGGWHWSPRMNTSLIKANEAFLRFRCLCRGKQRQRPWSAHLHTCKGLEWAAMGVREKKRKFHLVSRISHKKLNRLWPFSCFVMGRETARPRCHKKNGSERGLTVVRQLTCLKTNKRLFALTTGAYLRGLISAVWNSKAHQGSGFNRSLAFSFQHSCTEAYATTSSLHVIKKLKCQSPWAEPTS